MENRLTVGIDNSMEFLSIALSLGDSLVEERHIWGKRTPSQILPVELSHMLAGNGYTVNDVQLVAVTLGPGSFTGIRVALAFCKGLHEGKGIPLAGIPTLDVLASVFSFMDESYLCPVIDARKSEVFCCLYYASHGTLRRVIDYRAIKPEELPDLIKTPCLCFGTGAPRCEPHLLGAIDVRVIKEDFSRVSGEVLIREGIKKWEKGESDSLQPIYCRRSEAEIKFNVTIS